MRGIRQLEALTLSVRKLSEYAEVLERRGVSGNLACRMGGLPRASEMPIPYSARPGAHCARSRRPLTECVGAVFLAIDATSVATYTIYCNN